MGLIVRRLGGLGMMSILFVLALAINVWLVLEHYLAAYSALTLLRTEGWAIGSDGLIGPILAAIVPEATLPQALALTLSAGLWLLFLLVARELMQAVDMTRHLVESRAAGERAEAQAAGWEIGIRLLMLAFVVTGMVLAVRWDMELFTFRTLAGAAATEGADVSWMEHPSSQDPSLNTTYAFVLARVGAWGYLGVTFACAVALELLGRRLGDAVELLGVAWERFWEAAGEDDDVDPEAFDETVEDEPEDVDNSQADARVGLPTAVIGVAPPPPTPAESSAAVAPDQPSADAETAVPATPFFAPERPNRSAAPPVVPPTRSTPLHADLRDVIGGEKGERVGLAEALAAPRRYHVDMATGSVWRRSHWNALHGATMAGEEENAA